jgi:ribosome maturation factor RimP
VSANSAGSAAAHERLIALISPVIQRAGYDLEELVLTPMGRRSQLRVVIDCDEGISLDDIAGMSHAVANVLDDDEGVIGKAPYVLEVTSPGVDRPLTEDRHWRRAVGRLVEVPVHNASSADDSGNPEPTVTRGRIVAFDGAAVTLSVDGAEQTVQLADLGAGRVQLEFHRPSEAVKRERPHRQSKLRKGKAVQADGAP